MIRTIEAQSMIAMRVFERNGHQCLEKVRQPGPKTFELVEHSAEPYGGPYVKGLTMWDLLQWATTFPEQVTLIPAVAR
ncbi:MULTISPECIES: hypothetical protein [Bradyrhizobium]|jgi:hypothetical protein|uniref:Uncharacterized protein n=1 Tax=Bradyrhizobium elkanii TaxID=29448 RepID=A0ABV4EQS3_BRAEL|nr:hypothetical protein [Bradyrhizobium elkanii]MCP1758541.1 hypothetical protein [Bradyrhizobium elkanii]MCP1985061.1 hypothetical protein [Bradyrhizobium elkanii]MCS3695205.1 hypothetical protein [Bradyrhizobium elkanii]MCS3890570.1 hypothetical protein [Bradyrhizobium elkanii]MCS4220470.1 hypothetical protein [Bradyrhizobium elkanii]